MKKDISLYIDTSVSGQESVTLQIDGVRYEKKTIHRERRTQVVLPLIQELLREHQIFIEDITRVYVSTGPGSFTGLRVGCSVANALGFLLEVPVNDLKELALPTYS